VPGPVPVSVFVSVSLFGCSIVYVSIPLYLCTLASISHYLSIYLSIYQIRYAAVWRQSEESCTTYRYTLNTCIHVLRTHIQYTCEYIYGMHTYRVKKGDNPRQSRQQNVCVCVYFAHLWATVSHLYRVA